MSQGNIPIETHFSAIMSLSAWESQIKNLQNFYGKHALFTLTSSPVPEITGIAPVNISVPTVAGTETTGSTLTGTAGTWYGAPTLTYQWYRDGVAIAAATAITHVLVSADEAHTLTLKETATNHWGATTAESAATGTISA